MLLLSPPSPRYLRHSLLGQSHSPLYLCAVAANGACWVRYKVLVGCLLGCVVPARRAYPPFREIASELQKARGWPWMRCSGLSAAGGIFCRRVSPEGAFSYLLACAGHLRAVAIFCSRGVSKPVDLLWEGSGHFVQHPALSKWLPLTFYLAAILRAVCNKRPF